MSKKRFIIPIIAVGGLLFGIFMVFYSTRKPPVPPILYPPPTSPYEHAVAGSGIIEAASENILIGTPFNEIVEEVYVLAGDKVKRGDPLFRLNVETLTAELQEAEASVQRASALFEEEKNRFSFYEQLQDQRAVSRDDYIQRYFAVEEARAAFLEAQKRVGIIETNIKRSTIRAPSDGEILQVKIREGENADRNPFNEPVLVLFGQLDYYHVRVDIDETDAWRIQKGAKATAFVRGNSSIFFPMEFVRIEPYIIPKESLTGSNTERVDTRVLQIIYRFRPKDLPIYLGQILDVYIDALPGNLRYYEGKMVTP